MSEHTHDTFVEGCYRCDLSAAEATTPPAAQGSQDEQERRALQEIHAAAAVALTLRDDAAIRKRLGDIERFSRLALNVAPPATPPAAQGPATLPADLLALSEAATPGPWISLNGSVGSEADEQLVADAMREHPSGRDEADADLIAAAVNYVRSQAPSLHDDQDRCVR